MATKTFSGTFSLPLDTEAAYLDQMRFYMLGTTGEVMQGSASVLTVDLSGNYSVTLAYGKYSIYYYSNVSKKETKIGEVIVSSDTNVTTLQNLIKSNYEATDSLIIELESMVEDAETAQAAAESAESAALAAQSEVQALFDSSYDDAVIQAIGDNAVPYPDLHIPFEDGLRIQSGYGSSDTIRVDGTSYELPTKSVSFSRASGINLINKSGSIVELTNNNAIVESNGLYLHEAYTARTSISSGSTLNGMPDDDIETTTDLAPDGTTYWNVLSGVDNGYIIIYNGFNYTDGDYATLSCFVKKDTGVVRLRSYYNVSTSDASGSTYEFDSGNPSSSSVSGGTINDYGYIDYGEYYRIFMVVEYLDANSEVGQALFRIHNDGASSTPYIWGAEVTDGYGLMPYAAIGAGEYSVDIKATNCSTQVEGNIPSSSFSIIFDTDASKYSDSNRTFISISDQSDSGSFSGIVMQSLGSLVFRAGSNGGGDLSLGTPHNSASYNDSGVNRYVVVYDANAETVTSYVNGSLMGGSGGSVAGMKNPYDGKINIGSTSGTWRLNAHLKNVKIIHSALSANQAAVLGSAI